MWFKAAIVNQHCPGQRSNMIWLSAVPDTAQLDTPACLSAVRCWLAKDCIIELYFTNSLGWWHCSFIWNIEPQEFRCAQIAQVSILPHLGSAYNRGISTFLIFFIKSFPIYHHPLFTFSHHHIFNFFILTNLLEVSLSTRVSAFISLALVVVLVLHNNNFTISNFNRIKLILHKLTY